MDMDLMIDLAEIRRGPKREFVRFSFLLDTNPDLLAALTAPYLSELPFELYRKCLAWLYCQDEVNIEVANKSVLKSSNNYQQISKKDVKPAFVLPAPYQQVNLKKLKAKNIKNWLT